MGVVVEGIVTRVKERKWIQILLPKVAATAVRTLAKRIEAGNVEDAEVIK